jgi:hypothetical protein
VQVLATIVSAATVSVFLHVLLSSLGAGPLGEVARALRLDERGIRIAYLSELAFFMTAAAPWIVVWLRDRLRHAAQ